MTRFLFYFMAFTLAVGCTQPCLLDFIQLKSIGARDRPLQTIVFSVDSVPNDSDIWVFNIILPQETFDKINTLDEDIDEDTIPMSSPDYFSSFEISTCNVNPNSFKSKRITNENTLLYLEKALLVLQKDKIKCEDIQKVEYIRGRILEMRGY